MLFTLAKLFNIRCIRLQLFIYSPSDFIPFLDKQNSSFQSFFSNAEWNYLNSWLFKSHFSMQNVINFWKYIFQKFIATYIRNVITTEKKTCLWKKKRKKIRYFSLGFFILRLRCALWILTFQLFFFLIFFSTFLKKFFQPLIILKNIKFPLSLKKFFNKPMITKRYAKIFIMWAVIGAPYVEKSAFEKFNA